MKLASVEILKRPSASACVPISDPFNNTRENGNGSRVNESTTIPLTVVIRTGACPQTTNADNTFAINKSKILTMLLVFLKIICMIPLANFIDYLCKYKECRVQKMQNFFG